MWIAFHQSGCTPLHLVSCAVVKTTAGHLDTCYCAQLMHDAVSDSCSKLLAHFAVLDLLIYAVGELSCVTSAIQCWRFAQFLMMLHVARHCKEGAVCARQPSSSAMLALQLHRPSRERFREPWLPVPCSQGWCDCLLSSSTLVPSHDYWRLVNHLAVRKQ